MAKTCSILPGALSCFVLLFGCFFLQPGRHFLHLSFAFVCLWSWSQEFSGGLPGREAASVIKGIKTTPHLNPTHYFLAHTLKMQTQLINSAFTPDSMILCLPSTPIISISHFHNSQQNKIPSQSRPLCSPLFAAGAHLELSCSCAPSLLRDFGESQPSHAEFEAVTGARVEQLKTTLCQHGALINKLVFPFLFPVGNWMSGPKHWIAHLESGIVLESGELWGFGTKGGGFRGLCKITQCDKGMSSHQWAVLSIGMSQISMNKEIKNSGEDKKLRWCQVFLVVASVIPTRP